MPKQKRNRGKKNLKGNISCYNLDAALSATEDSLFFYCFLVSLLVFFIYLVFFSRPTTQPSKLTISFKRLAKLSRGGKKKKKKRRAVGHLGRKLFCRQVAVIIMSVGWRRFESGLTLGEKQGVLAYN